MGYEMCKIDEPIEEIAVVYYFHAAIWKHNLLSNTSQVGVLALARPSSTFQQIEIEVPSIDVQRKVVAILGIIQEKNKLK